MENLHAVAWCTARDAMPVIAGAFEFGMRGGIRGAIDADAGLVGPGILREQILQAEPEDRADLHEVRDRALRFAPLHAREERFRQTGPLRGRDEGHGIRGACAADARPDQFQK